MKSRRVLSALLSIVMLIVLIPVTVGAETEGCYTYDVIDGKAIITEVSHGVVGDVIIPNILGGYPVIGIGNYAFKFNMNITSVVIPEGIEYIGDDVFNACTNLTSVSIPSSLIDMGHNPFQICYNLTDINVNKNNTVYHSTGNCLIETETKTLITGCKNSKIPTDGSVTIIGDSAFDNYKYLDNIIIPECITEIGNRAFFGCDSLTSVVIPDTMESIGDSAFRGCDNLTKVNLPESIKYIGDNAFMDSHYVTVLCHYNSYAYSYAVRNNIKFELVSMPGDVNSDSKINISDATMVLKHIAGWDITINTDASDVNKDDKVNISDVTLILKFIAGWNVVLK